jgi:pimeloyl-ACP methyl ester carboxylesterase
MPVKPTDTLRLSRRPAEDFNLPESELRRRLISGTGRHRLQCYLGKALYRELRQLAIRAADQAQARTTRVLVLPGIMGSQLGYRGRGDQPDEVIWVDPQAIESGRLARLALPERRPARALGVQLFKYLKLKLTLENAGFDVDFHAYDWRASIDELGWELLERIRKERTTPLALVAHSMGGLVARAAMAGDAQRHIGRLIMLATPNHGSFAPVLALRGAYPPVRRLAQLDHLHDAETHAQRVFATFPGLYQMLPARERLSGLDLYDPVNWPRDSRAPRARLLKKALRVREQFAPADERVIIIVGTDQPTITRLSLQDDEFRYHVTDEGDGTVPVDLALLEGAAHYFAPGVHSELPNDGRVIAAIGELLAGGETHLLQRAWQHAGAPAQLISERELRADDVSKRSWKRMSLRERRHILGGLVLPD